jgi:hypothetical protein
MGIYSDGNVYGVRISSNGTVVYEKIYTAKINKYEIDEVIAECSKLEGGVSLKFFMSFTTGYETSATYMTWCPGTLKNLQDLHQ